MEKGAFGSPSTKVANFTYFTYIRLRKLFLIKTSKTPRKHIYIYIYIYIYARVWARSRTRACVCVCMWVRACVYVCVCIMKLKDKQQKMAAKSPPFLFPRARCYLFCSNLTKRSFLAWRAMTDPQVIFAKYRLAARLFRFSLLLFTL